MAKDRAPLPGQFKTIFSNSGLDKPETIRPAKRRWRATSQLELAPRLQATWFGHPTLSPVSNQLPYNTCVAHAACRMVETWANRQSKPVALDADCLHQCVYGYHPDLPANNASNVINAMRDKGIPRVQGFKPTYSCPVPLEVVASPKIDRIGTEGEVKEHLRSKGPVLAVLTLRKDFEHLAPPAVYSDGAAAGETFNHAVLIIGFDDNMHGGAWHCQNSFGPGWGDQGFFWLKYGSGQLLADDRHGGFIVA